MNLDLRPILELSTAELHALAVELFDDNVPPLEAVENEDWGRDYLLQCLQQVSAAEFAARGLGWAESSDSGHG